MATSSSHLLDIVKWKLEYYEMVSGTLLIPPMMRPSHACICVEVILDGKREGGHGAYMNVECISTCKKVLTSVLMTHAPNCCPLPYSSKVTMHYTKLSDAVQVRSASDVGFCPRLLSVS